MRTVFVRTRIGARDLNDCTRNKGHQTRPQRGQSRLPDTETWKCSGWTARDAIPDNSLNLWRLKSRPLAAPCGTPTRRPIPSPQICTWRGEEPAAALEPGSLLSATHSRETGWKTLYPFLIAQFVPVEPASVRGVTLGLCESWRAPIGCSAGRAHGHSGLGLAGTLLAVATWRRPDRGLGFVPSIRPPGDYL